MFSVDFSWFALGYILFGFGLILALWLYYDFRDSLAYRALRQRVSFHCIKCNHIYVSIPEGEVSSCPACGFKNTRLKF